MNATMESHAEQLYDLVGSLLTSKASLEARCVSMLEEDNIPDVTLADDEELWHQAPPIGLEDLLEGEEYVVPDSDSDNEGGIELPK